MTELRDSPAETPTVTASTDLAIEVDGLRKRFGRTNALNGIDLAVPRNSIFGFLGPNGAGKSTTMKILVGLLRPTAGSASVVGHDVQHDSLAARASIGYLPQDVSYWSHLTVRGVLSFTARQYLQGQRRDLAERVDETIELAGLTRLADRRVGKLSGGERQRLGVAEAWVGRPDVLILDEPSAGLDPEGRHEVLGILDALREHATIFYSTHILDDVERVSDATRDPRSRQHRRPGFHRVVPHRGRRLVLGRGERSVRRGIRRSGGTAVGAVGGAAATGPVGGHRRRSRCRRARPAAAARRRARRERHRLPAGATQPGGHLPRPRGSEP